MRPLLQRATYLFRQYPVLWLPVLAVAVIDFCMTLAVRHGSTLYTQHLHSMLDGPSPTSLSLVWILLPLIAGIIVVAISVLLGCYSLGVVTRAVAGGQFEPDGGFAPAPRLQWGIPRGWITAGYSVTAAALAAVCMPVLLVFLFKLNPLHGPGLKIAVVFFMLVGVVLAVRPLIDLVVRNLNRWLPQSDAEPLLQSPRQAAYGLAIVGAIVYSALSRLRVLAERPVLPVLGQHHLALHALDLASELVRALVLVYVEILFILLVQQEVQESTHIPQGDESPVDGLTGSL